MAALAWLRPDCSARPPLSTALRVGYILEHAPLLCYSNPTKSFARFLARLRENGPLPPRSAKGGDGPAGVSSGRFRPPGRWPEPADRPPPTFAARRRASHPPPF